eukprot:m.134984 g.134984  ORF g.134984 m.134984 type:complete len:328 (-) comp16930_c0_seq4:145-1128(-)
MTNGVLLTNLLVYPTLKYFVLPKRGQKITQRTYAKLGAVCVAFLAVAVALDIGTQTPNYFRQLQVSRDATRSQIKTAFKSASRLHHPDKSSDPNAADNFMALQRAYEAILDENSRKVYDRFGPEFYEDPHRDQRLSDTSSMAFYMLPFYAIMLFLLLIMSSAGNGSAARPWNMLLLGGVFFIELFMRFDDWDLPLTGFVFPYTTKHEKIVVLHAMVPLVAQMATAYASLVYIDWPAVRHAQQMTLLMQIAEQMDQAPWGKTEEGSSTKSAEQSGLTRAQRAKVDRHKLQRVGQIAEEQQAKKGSSLSVGSLLFGLYLVVQIYSMLFK